MDHVREQNPQAYYRIVARIGQRLADRVRLLSGTSLGAGASQPLLALRTGRDQLGDRDVPGRAYFGVQTLRAVENFAISGVALRHFPRFINAFAGEWALMTVGNPAPRGQVKHAVALGTQQTRQAPRTAAGFNDSYAATVPPRRRRRRERSRPRSREAITSRGSWLGLGWATMTLPPSGSHASTKVTPFSVYEKVATS